MDINGILPGQEVQLTTNSVFYKNIYESRIQAVDEQTITIGTPSYKGLFVPLNIGFILNLRVFTSSGVCVFATEVLDRDISGHTIKLRKPKNITETKAHVSSVRRCKFTTVTSGKGGVGKTSFIINYAIALAQQGKRVLLFDADLGMANIDVLLKTSSKYNIIDVIEGNRNMNEVITEAVGGIHLIAGGSGMQKLSSLTPAQFHRITSGFSYLEAHYDFVLIDTGAGLSKNVTTFVYAADESIVITTPEPHAITDAYSIIKVLLDETADINLKLIVNKCETPAEGTEVLKRITHVIRNFLNYKIVPICFIPETKVVGKSIREQVPFMLSQPNSDIAKLLTSLAQAACMGQDAPVETKRAGIGGFVERLAKLFG